MSESNISPTSLVVQNGFLVYCSANIIPVAHMSLYKAYYLISFLLIAQFKNVPYHNMFHPHPADIQVLSKEDSRLENQHIFQRLSYNTNHNQRV